MNQSENGAQRPQWGSRMAFVIAAAGGAIGLGNIWRFPYLTGTNGGGAFVFVYLLTILLVGLPIMTSEVMIGKSTQLSPVRAFEKIRGGKTPWSWLGVLAIVAAFTILSFYSVVSGWTLHYIWLSLGDKFAGRSPDEIYSMFGQLYENGPLNVGWHLVVMVIGTWIVYRGIKGGIEKATKVLMPFLLLVLLVLLVNSLMSPGAAEGFRFMFYPDFSKLTGASVLEAVGQAFFTLSLGMGAVITYGSYLDPDSDLAIPCVAIVAADTLMALLAGLVVFPIVFSFGFEPSAGPGLVFKTLPVAFSQMPGGFFMSILFFVLLFVAALTSAISLLEVVISYCVDAGYFSRRKASVITGIAIFLVGILPALSGGPLADVKIPILDRTFFDAFDYLSSNWFLPLGGFFIATFVGWVLPGDFRKKEFLHRAPKWWMYGLWLFALRFLAPVGVLFVFLNGLGIFS